jgi:hypothetical protein
MTGSSEAPPDQYSRSHQPPLKSTTEPSFTPNGPRLQWNRGRQQPHAQSSGPVATLLLGPAMSPVPLRSLRRAILQRDARSRERQHLGQSRCSSRKSGGRYIRFCGECVESQGLVPGRVLEPGQASARDRDEAEAPPNGRHGSRHLECFIAPVWLDF